MKEENVVGQWALCSRGRLGKIEGRKTLEWGESWVGTGIDGTPWASREPRLVCDADSTWLDQFQMMLPG